VIIQTSICAKVAECIERMVEWGVLIELEGGSKDISSGERKGRRCVQRRGQTSGGCSCYYIIATLT